jgi:hypothetical protein
VRERRTACHFREPGFIYRVDLCWFNLSIKVRLSDVPPQAVSSIEVFRFPGRKTSCRVDSSSLSNVENSVAEGLGHRFLLHRGSRERASRAQTNLRFVCAAEKFNSSSIISPCGKYVLSNHPVGPGNHTHSFRPDLLAGWILAR